MHQKSQNIRQHLIGYGIQPVFSTQIVLHKLSIGLTAGNGYYVSQSFKQSTEVRDVGVTQDDQAAIDAKPDSRM